MGVGELGFVWQSSFVVGWVVAFELVVVDFAVAVVVVGSFAAVVAVAFGLSVVVGFES